MEKPHGNFVYRNLANAVSIIGVLPLFVLYLENGYQYLIPLLIFNNVMDDLDGVLAGKLNIRSRFGADIDNVCDAVAHTAMVWAVGAHYGGLVLIICLIPATSILIRATSRLNPDIPGGGTPTNELMRQMLFVLLLMQLLGVDHGLYLIPIFVMHSISMIAPFRFDFLIRGRAKSATAVSFVNVALVAAWLSPPVLPFIATAFFVTYIYSFAAGGNVWLKERKINGSSKNS